MRYLILILIATTASAGLYVRNYEIKDLPDGGAWEAKGWQPITAEQADVLRCEQAGGVWTNGACVLPAPVPRVPPSQLLETAHIFRQILHLHFGAGSETNSTITSKSVEAYFVRRRLTLPKSERVDDADDGILLDRGFAAIAEWTGDGTIWSFPWELVP